MLGVLADLVRWWEEQCFQDSKHWVRFELGVEKYALVVKLASCNDLKSPPNVKFTLQAPDPLFCMRGRCISSGATPLQRVPLYTAAWAHPLHSFVKTGAEVVSRKFFDGKDNMRLILHLLVFAVLAAAEDGLYGWLRYAPIALY